jgi:ATP-dependent phosphoenolpyruvate carboxykinase
MSIENGSVHKSVGLRTHGITNTSQVYWNLSTPALYEQAICRREGVLAHLGPLVVRTGQHTGRSPNDKFAVREPSSAVTSGGARSTARSNRSASLGYTTGWSHTCN